MLERVLGIHESELTLGTIQALVADSETEDQYLEFKSELPTKDGSGYVEYARDVTALANAGGGLIVFGIKETGDKATGFSPVMLGRETSTLVKTLNSTVYPRLRGVRLLPVEDRSAGTDMGYLIVDVDRSALAPHMVNENAGFSCWRRVGPNKVPLSEAEIERMYRERFALADSARTRLSAQIARAKNSTRGSSLSLAVVPSLAQQLRLSNMGALNMVRQLAVRDCACGLDPSYPEKDVVSAFRRIDVGFTSGRDLSDQSKWFSIDDEGSFLRLIRLRGEPRSGSVWPEPRVVSSDDLVWPLFIAEAVIESLLKYREIARDFNIAGPALCAVSMKVSPRIVAFVQTSTNETMGHLNQDVTSEYSFEVDQLFDAGGLLRLARDIISDLESAFGVVRGPMIAESGVIDYANVAVASREQVRQWMIRALMTNA